MGSIPAGGTPSGPNPDSLSGWLANTVEVPLGSVAGSVVASKMTGLEVMATESGSGPTAASFGNYSGKERDHSNEGGLPGDLLNSHYWKRSLES